MPPDDRPTLVHPGSGFRGMTELHAAAHNGDIDAMRRALASGLDPNAKDSYRGYTPLHWLMDMAATGGPRFEMLHLLVGAGAMLDVVADDGYSSTALSLAREAGTEDSDLLADELVRLGAHELPHGQPT